MLYTYRIPLGNPGSHVYGLDQGQGLGNYEKPIII